MAEKLARAKTAAILAGYLIPRLGCTAEALALVEATGLPFATMFMDKTALDETHPQYIGMYDGRLMNPEIREFIEGCDCILNLGALWSDFNTGAFTANLDPARVIGVRHHQVRVGRAIFPNVEMRDALAALAGKVSKKQVPAPKVHGLGEPQGAPGDQITPDYLYPRWEKFFKPGDLVIAETGTVSMGLGLRPDAPRLGVSQPDALVLPSAGPPPRPSARRWPRPSGAPSSSPVKVRTRSPSRRSASSAATA